ncbi:MAG: prepilin-type N-terminal cleavage/methylation domain-containing protein [Fibrobacter sp.]|jgi:prepilin-type N-terminal cleavage/methylation domain-containing protein|nr:prepilin-type N-terminal cleavage/methylation domain-containing protein [Fibrobacter sp.]
MCGVKQKSKAGFNLIELSVAIVLTALAFSMVLSFFETVRSSFLYFEKKQQTNLQYYLELLRIEEELKKKCPLYFTRDEIEKVQKHQIDGAARCVY